MIFLAKIYCNPAFREGKGPLQIVSRATNAVHALMIFESNNKVIKTEVCGKNKLKVEITVEEMEIDEWEHQKQVNGYKLLEMKQVPQNMQRNMTIIGINGYKKKYLQEAYKIFGLKKNKLYILGLKDCQNYVAFIWKEIFGDYPQKRLQQGLYATGSGALGSSGLVSSGMMSGLVAPVLLGSGVVGFGFGCIGGARKEAKKVPQ